MNVCPNCGAEVSARMKFCGECGTRLDYGQTTESYAPAFGDEGEVPVAGGPDGGAALIELDQVEGTAGRRMHGICNEGVTVGGSPGREIFLDDGQGSREHAEIGHAQGGN